MKQKIDKIIITGQILRGNYIPIRWFYKLFADLLEMVTGLPVFFTTTKTLPVFNENNAINIDIKRIYDNYNIPFEYTKREDRQWINSWAKIYYRTDYNKDTYDYVNEIFKNSLVLSYETEDCISAIFNHFNIEQIDINLDPIRFLDDVMLCFKTNNKKVYNKILKYKVEEDFIKLKANYIKTYYDFYNFVQVDEDTQTKVLFLGQCACDKTLIDTKTNEIYSILNHKIEFENSIKGFDKILYKRHPHATKDIEILEYIKSLGCVEMVDENFYKLMSDDSIKKVVSISSGTCSEARYFGKDVQTLLKEGVARQTENKFDKDKYVSVYQSYFSLNFWSEILSPLIKTKKYKKEICFSKAPNLLRNLANLHYSYENFEHTKIKQDIIPQINNDINKNFETVKRFARNTLFAVEHFQNDDELES